MQAEVVIFQEVGLCGLPVQSPTLNMKAETREVKHLITALERIFWQRVDADNINYYTPTQALVAVGHKLYEFVRAASGIYEPGNWRLIAESS